MPESFLGAVRVPPFPERHTWHNVARPLTTADLRGRLVLLDFWTSCCINCMHIVPHLHAIEEHFQHTQEVVVIGVHSAKFSAERDDRHLARAIQRLGITHPVLNDADMHVWRSYAVRAWPTLMFVDPRGRVIGKHEGEFDPAEMIPLLEEMLREFRASGHLSTARQLPPTVLPPPPSGPLAYPAAVLHDADAQRLIISDSGHHQIVLADLITDGATASERLRIGSGVAGFRDGPAHAAQFRNPQGLARDGAHLFVADTGNHSIRLVDLRSGAVRTLAGTGQQARRYRSSGAATATPLSSPWGLAHTDGALWIAMAGQHQVWHMPDPLASDDVRQVQRFAGTGHEALRDGPRARAHLAQPSGIVACDDGILAFSDSETSAVRLLDLRPGPDAPGEETVRTLIGDGLFTFGDIDGDASTARLQHPLGIAYDAANGTLCIADTFNNRVKRLDVATGIVTTWLGSGAPALHDGVGTDAALFEPNGLHMHVSDGALYIADTNNHAIRRADLTTGNVTTITLSPQQP